MQRVVWPDEVSVQTTAPVKSFTQRVPASAVTVARARTAKSDSSTFIVCPFFSYSERKLIRRICRCSKPGTASPILRSSR